MTDREQSIAKIKHVFERHTRWFEERDGPQFDADVVKRCEVLDASAAGTAAFGLYVGQEYSNSGGILHGGAAALLFDMFTSAAFIPRHEDIKEQPEFKPPGGVSWAMNITCIRPLPLPARIRIESQVVHEGQSMALVRGAIMSEDRKKTYFVSEHHKANASGPRRSSGKISTNSKL